MTLQHCVACDRCGKTVAHVLTPNTIRERFGEFVTLEIKMPNDVEWPKNQHGMGRIDICGSCYREVLGTAIQNLTTERFKAFIAWLPEREEDDLTSG